MKRTPAETAAKTQLSRKFGLVVNGCQPSDKAAVDFIVERTGWARPSKQNRRLFMLKFLHEHAGGSAPPDVSARPVRPIRPKRATRPKKSFYQSDEWRALRYQVLVKFGARCQCCGASAKDGKQIHVDHIKPRSKYPLLELDFNNLQVLCEDCNLGKLHIDQTDWRPSEAEVLPEFAAEHLRSIQ